MYREVHGMKISALNRKIEPYIMGVNVWVCDGDMGGDMDGDMDGGYWLIDRGVVGMEHTP